MKSRSGLARAALVPLALALALAAGAPGEARAKWRGIAAADSQIVFAGRDFDAYRASWHYLPFAESAHQLEGYQASWTAPNRRVPVFWARLQILAPGYYFDTTAKRPIGEFPGLFGWFRGLDVAHGATGEAKTAVGGAEYLLFIAGDYLCATFRFYIDGAWSASPHSAGNTRMFGLYCPVSGAMDGAEVERVLAKIGIREVAVPEAEPREAAPTVGKANELTRLVKEGDMAALRRLAVTGLDPDAFVFVDHPKYLGGGDAYLPILAAAALYGHTEMVAFLLDRGASVRGAGALAICAAVSADREEAVDVLLEHHPPLARYDSCGAGGNLTPYQLSLGLDRWDIAEKLRDAEPGAPPHEGGSELARLVRAGDMAALRRRAAGGLGPDAWVYIDHPGFWSGDVVYLPILVAAALYGHTEMVAFLLEKGASTRGAGARAICAAVVTGRAAVVDVLLENDPTLARHDSCGRRGNRSVYQLSLSSHNWDIAEKLRDAGG